MNYFIPGFNGDPQDPISAKIIMGNGYRAYDPVVMRFVCPDDLSPFDAGGLNGYAYCQGDPINRADPDGHHSILGWAGIVAGVVVGALMTPVSGGSTLALSLSVLSILTAVASTGLAVAQQIIEDTHPATASILGWVALGTGIISALSSAVLSWIEPGARSLSFFLKGTSNRPLAGMMLSGDSGGGTGANPLHLPDSVSTFQRQRIWYEMDAYDAAREQLHLPPRTGARPELGLYRRIVRESNPRLPVYSQDLREIHPVPERLEQQLQSYYNEFGIPEAQRSYRVNPLTATTPRSGLITRPRPLPPAPRRPLPPPPYSAQDPHPVPSYPDNPDYITRRGQPPAYEEP